jgi:hypothetical protein
MLKLHATESFAAWFRALDDVAAEEIATGVELIEALGPGRAPENSSDTLLWCQCAPEHMPNERLLRRIEAYTPFAAQVRGLVAHLETEAVRRKIAAIADERALRAFALLRGIASHSGLRHMYGHDEHARAQLQEQCRVLFDTLGITGPVAKPTVALRELTVRTRRPGLRVLYGADEPGARGLLILGESLDRQAYGPSVRHALAVWRDFIHGTLEHAGEAWERRSTP